MAKREIFTGPSPFDDLVRSRDTFLRPINLIGFVSPEAVNTLSPIRSSSMLISSSVVFIRVPAKKQGLAKGLGAVVAADALRPASPNPNATPVLTTSFEAARKLRRDVA